MRFGINTFLFASPFTNQAVKWFPLFKQWGFDSVELAIEDPDDFDAAYVKRELASNGLLCGSVCAAMGEGRDLRGSEAEQQTALSYLMKLMDQMLELDCPLLAGPLYSSVGRADAVEANEYSQQWNTVVHHLRRLAEYAQVNGLKLAIEPLNRFETDFINTCTQGLAMIKDVNHSSLGLHLDTFHMNIEEKDLAESIRQAGPSLFHLHACGSDRGTPGGDHTDWNSISQALTQIGYTGDIVIESFTKEVKVIARAAAIWRDIEPSGKDIAQKGLWFLHTAMKSKNLRK
jgi:D-psicose/D-tagatose/L-ribulose 3-epimerase